MGDLLRAAASNQSVVRLAEMVAARERGLRDHEREVEQLRVMATTLVNEFQADRERRAVTVLEHLTEPSEIVARLEELYAHGDRELRIFVTNRQQAEGHWSRRRPRTWTCFGRGSGYGSCAWSRC